VSTTANIVVIGGGINGSNIACRHAPDDFWVLTVLRCDRKQIAKHKIEAMMKSTILFR